jgi:hypothetical protein
MFDFHYNVIAKRYGKNARLLFTDTDSLCYHLITDDVYRDMMEYRHLLDTSNYPRDHPLYSAENMKVIDIPPSFFINCCEELCYPLSLYILHNSYLQKG